MGQRMAQHLLSDYNFGVCNRTKSKAEELLAAGATWFENPSSLASWSEVLILKLSDIEANEDVLFGAEGITSQTDK